MGRILLLMEGRWCSENARWIEVERRWGVHKIPKLILYLLATLRVVLGYQHIDECA
jgi:hypothetical protein